MRMRPLLHTRFVSLLFIFLCFLLLVSCGSPTTTSASLPASSLTATACAQTTRVASSQRTALGTLKSIAGQTLIVTNQRGTNITVTYTGSTRFTQESVLPATSLQEGTNVRITVANNGNAYAARSIMVLGNGNNGFLQGNGTPGSGPFVGRGRNPCAGRGRGAGNGANNFRGIVGTVGQLNGNTLTITDVAGSNYTVTITSQTQIVGTKSATAANLKVGQPLTVTGSSSSQGLIVANTVIILLSLPVRTPTPAAAQ